ncbi:MAG: DUF1828 domain-containing protein [Dehalococcoidia bacterium]|nr:DUF1828 domain-containing protein [Dehalococcoidia bacterium]
MDRSSTGTTRTRGSLMTLCENVASHLSTYLSQNIVCGPIEAGYEVLVTPLLYPDRDNIELFLTETPDGLIRVSDLGQTMLKLSDYGFVPNRAPRRRAMIYQITASLGVRYENGSVLVDADQSTLGSKVWDLLMAVQKLSDLAFTVPAYVRASFSDEVEDYLVGRNIQYNRGVQLYLPTGYSFIIDFVIQETSLVHVLSANSQSYARERASLVYQNFMELREAQDPRQRVAVLDDRSEVWSDNTSIPMSHAANIVVRWSKKAELERVLTT